MKVFATFDAISSQITALEREVQALSQAMNWLDRATKHDHASNHKTYMIQIVYELHGCIHTEWLRSAMLAPVNDQCEIVFSKFIQLGIVYTSQSDAVNDLNNLMEQTQIKNSQLINILSLRAVPINSVIADETSRVVSELKEKRLKLLLLEKMTIYKTNIDMVRHHECG